MRVSDEDRQRAIDELRRHCAAGRIDVDEYAARIERALSATTLAELDEVRADLPMLRIAEPGGHPIWAGGRRRAVPAGRALESAWPGVGRDGPEHGGSAVGEASARIGAIGVAVITVAVVLAALAISLAFEWGWALVLLSGWVAGLVQGRMTRRSRPPG
jgi:hypothetical protein